MKASEDLDCLSQQAKQKVLQALHGGDSADAIYLHRENAVRYYARAMATMRPPSCLN
jgi:hypothetical protein